MTATVHNIADYIRDYTVQETEEAMAVAISTGYLHHLFRSYDHGHVNRLPSGAFIAAPEMQRMFTIAIDNQVSVDTDGQAGLILVVENQFFDHLNHLFNNIKFCYFEERQKTGQWYLVLSFRGTTHQLLKVLPKMLAIELSSPLLYRQIKDYRYLHLATAKNTGAQVDIVDIKPHALSISTMV